MSPARFIVAIVGQPGAAIIVQYPLIAEHHGVGIVAGICRGICAAVAHETSQIPVRPDDVVDIHIAPGPRIVSWIWHLGPYCEQSSPDRGILAYSKIGTPPCLTEFNGGIR